MACQAPSSSTSVHPWTFFSKITKENYNNNISKRPFCMEKGFLFQYAPFTGYSKAISSVVKKHRWQIFYLYPDDVLTKVVPEFYAHLTSPKNAFIYVPSVSVLFNEDSINVQYGLPEDPDEHSQFIKTITTEGLNQVLTGLCVEGMTWTISQNNCYTIDRPKDDDNEDGEETTAENKNIKKERKEKIEFVHIESKKDEADMTQTSTPTTTTTTPKSTIPMTEQECMIHQLVDDLKKSDADDEEEVPTNQLKTKHYKQVAGKSVRDDTGEVERKQCYKHATRKST
ncbi:hypothetical protein J1N35_007472 [Gossypium stocksii]|uniref:Uncharacterized protein n=1 Tax=Gossypium stocksii TaxID=47602 RepID=A0A9D3W6J4_9ROSI|nr:hypothetical protein J1N35_007472 [Gossypium stocksii]